MRVMEAARTRRAAEAVPSARSDRTMLRPQGRVAARMRWLDGANCVRLGSMAIALSLLAALIGNHTHPRRRLTGEPGDGCRRAAEARLPSVGEIRASGHKPRVSRTMLDSGV